MNWLTGARSSQRAELGRLAATLGGLGVLLPRVLAPAPSRFIRRSVAAPGGHFIFGPHFALSAGAYFVVLWLDIGDGMASPRLVLDAVAWNDDRPTTLADREYRIAAGESRIVLLTLRFELAAAQSVELRAWSDLPVDGTNLLGVHIHRVNETLLRAEPGIAWAEGKQRTVPTRARRAPEAMVLDGSEHYRTLELWLAFDPASAGDAAFGFRSVHGEVSTIEVLDAAKAAPFALADGRALFHLAFPSQASRRIFGKRTVSAQLDGHTGDFGAATIPALAGVNAAHPTHRVRLRASADPAQATLRLSGWILDDLANPPPVSSPGRSGAPGETFIALNAGETIEFAPSQRAIFVFETGPDRGAVECTWGSRRYGVDLLAASRGLRSLAIPEDLDASAEAAEPHLRDHGAASESRIEIFALGSSNEASSGSEVVVQSVWRNYPFASSALTELDFAGAYEVGPHHAILSQGSAALAAGAMPAVQLVRHDSAGLAAIRYRGRVVAIDLYAACRDSILVLPALAEPILSPETLGSALGGEAVHPALTHLFRRMRPDWLRPQDTTGAGPGSAIADHEEATDGR
jgi:hypothetical protein